jgi:hypothetical protein
MSVGEILRIHDRVFWVSPRLRAFAGRVAALRAGLRDHGYVEGKIAFTIGYCLPP